MSGALLQGRDHFMRGKGRLWPLCLTRTTTKKITALKYANGRNGDVAAAYKSTIVSAMAKK